MAMHYCRFRERIIPVRIDQCTYCAILAVKKPAGGLWFAVAWVLGFGGLAAFLIAKGLHLC